MNRRSFFRTVPGGAACLCGPRARSEETAPRRHPSALLTDAAQRPLRASDLKPDTTYLFHFPYRSTPVFLLNLDTAMAPLMVAGNGETPYRWPGGVGHRQSIVAYAAICPQQLEYPSREATLISFRTRRARRGVQDRLIHCCGDQSQFDPAQAAAVLAGPAQRPLAAVLLAHDALEDTLTAYATLGDSPFERFFARHQARLGAAARELAGPRTRVWALDEYCRNTVAC